MTSPLANACSDAQSSAAPLELPLDEMLARVGGDRELLATLAELQKSESPKSLAEIRTFLDAGDAAHLERAAHRLAGSLLVFEAADAAAAARTLEQLAREGRMTDARQQAAVVEHEVQRMHEALDRLFPPPRT